LTTATQDGARTSGIAAGILGNRVETDRELLERPRSSPDFRGSVSVAPESLEAGVRERVVARCAPKAIGVGRRGLEVDRGRCIMCGWCREAAPEVFRIESRFAEPVKAKGELIVAQTPSVGPGTASASVDEIGERLRLKVNQVLGRSLAIREVDAGSCNGCEVEVTALSNPVYDVERFGVHFVASPRHADVLLVTGVSSRNLELALRRTYEATPEPKVVVAVGACACTGGIFGETYASGGGIAGVVPVDVFVPGCPPRPEAILYGVLLAVDRVRPKA